MWLRIKIGLVLWIIWFYDSWKKIEGQYQKNQATTDSGKIDIIGPNVASHQIGQLSLFVNGVDTMLLIAKLNPTIV